MRPNRQDVLECYRRILEREPENDEIVDRRLAMGQDLWSLLRDFAHSDEFRARAGKLSSYSLMKVFSPKYLARGMSEEDRLGCAIFNYSFLQERLDPSHLVRLFKTSLPILSNVGGVPLLDVAMSMFDGPPDEGENSLVVTLDGTRLAVLTFSAVPARLFGLDGTSAFFISRLQGYLGAGACVGEVTKKLGDISLPYLLMTVLEGIARASGTDHLIGVDAGSQPSFKEEYEQLFLRNYDEIFASLGSARLPSGFHLMTLPRRQRPLEQIIASHRARTVRKRAVKQALSDEASACWKSYLRQRTPETMPERARAARRSDSREMLAKLAAAGSKLGERLRALLPSRRPRRPSMAFAEAVGD